MSGQHIMAAVVAASRKLDDERGVVHVCVSDGKVLHSWALYDEHRAEHRAEAEAAREAAMAPKDPELVAAAAVRRRTVHDLGPRDA